MTNEFFHVVASGQMSPHDSALIFDLFLSPYLSTYFATKKSLLREARKGQEQSKAQILLFLTVNETTTCTAPLRFFWLGT